MFQTSLRDYAEKYHKLFLISICCICYFATSFYYVEFSSPPSGDEPHYLVISQTLLTYHSLDVMLDYKHGDYRSFYPIYLAPHVAPNEHGQLLPIHGIGGPVLWLLPYSFFGRLGAVFFISLLSVFIVLNIFAFLTTMAISKRYAFLVSLAYAFASPLYIYSHLTFIEPIGALICIYVLRKIFQHEITLPDVIISSTLLGILPWVHIRFALFEIPLFFMLLYALYQKYRLSNYKYYLCYLLPITLLFFAFEIYNFKVWGTLNPAANEISDNSKPFAVAPFAGILGVFFDQQYGLFPNFPVFFFLLPGIILAAKKKFLPYNLLMLILAIPYIIVFTSFKAWSGGWCPPTRFIFILLPLSSFYLAFALEQIHNLLSQLVFYFTMLAGFLYNLLTLPPLLLAFNFGTGKNRALLNLQVFNRHITDLMPSLFLPNQTHLFVAWIGTCLALTLLMIYPNYLKKRAANT